MRKSLTDDEMEELNHIFFDLSDDENDGPIDPFSWRESAGDTCLHIAVMRENLRAVELLIKGGIDVNAKGDMGSTALHVAKYKGNDELIKFLLENGASTEIRNEFGIAPLEDPDKSTEKSTRSPWPCDRKAK